MSEVAPGVTRKASAFANLYLIGSPGGPWALVDTGLAGGFESIRAAAEARFGKGTKPEAIFLTHGHQDHVGSALALATFWDIPIYAHRLEMPFLTGKSLYPPTDPTVGGALAFMSRFMPPNGTDLGEWVRELPAEGEVPGFPDWKWHWTPGHSPGHVAYFRANDRTLLAGDALATVNLNSASDIVTQKQRLCRPPAPFTCDWLAARRSLAYLGTLEPMTIACGHGLPVSGPSIAGNLQAFAEDMVPGLRGRYISEPAITDENGIVELPPPVPDPLPGLLAGAGIAALTAGALTIAAQRNKRTRMQQGE